MPLPFLFKSLLLWLGIFLCSGAAFAQQPAQPDSAATPGDTIRTTPSDRIIKGLEEYSKRKSLPAKAVKSLFNFNRKKTSETGPDPELISREYSQHDFKIVRRIDIKTLDAFGYDINDSLKVPTKLFQKAANSIHIKTHRGRIRNKLLFRKGQELEPQTLIESERLLRQTAHILDARIRVNESTTTEDSVDIIVITKDVFSISGSFNYNAPKTMGIIALRDVNFLGLGHQFRNRLWFGIDDLPQAWQYQGNYFVENIYRTYISSNVHYFNDYRNERGGVSFDRGFFATTTKYAGGAAATWFRNRTFAVDSSQDLRFNAKDVWLGRSFKFKSYNLGFENPARIVVGARVTNIHYTQRPEGVFRNTTLYLASVGYSYRKYYKDKYLFGFGRTEDVPAGNLFALNVGYEYAPGRIRQYMGVRSSFGKHKLNFGYLYGGAEFGSFVHNGNWQQGVINTEVLYFTKLYDLNGWLLRNFVWNRMTYGLRRDPFEILNINNQEGIRGFRSGNLYGQNKFVVNLESNLFTPISFVGFRLAGIVFADFGWISKTDNISPFKEKPYQGYGVGIRFRNEYMSFSTIQLLLAYYPRIPEGDGFNNFKFYESSRRYYEFQDFYYSQPGVAGYR
ncbi:MAG TPA: hypothetical protein VK927_10755 [Adhaeribacter sp.]|nr:hypothetical protein [Adhaeribacter sp.]